MNFDPEIEEILKPNLNRFILHPIKHDDIWQLAKKSVASFWTVEEINFSQDIDDWNNVLTDNEREFLKYILAFFACADGIVNENININFYDEIQIPESRYFLSMQNCIEAIHAETYSKMLETYIQDTAEKERLFNSIKTIPVIKKKIEWVMKYLNKDISFPERLIAFLALEGIFFSGSFCAIFWMGTRGLLKGLCLSNAFISRDEGMHAMHTVLLYKKLKQKLSQEQVNKILTEAYEIEAEFITEALPSNLKLMNAKKMKEYIQYITDYWLIKLGYDKLFNTPNPCDFMEFISVESKANFFEIIASEYSKAEGIANSNKFEINDDF